MRLTHLQPIHVYEKRTENNFERTVSFVYTHDIDANIQPVDSQLDRTEYGERAQDMIRLISHKDISRGSRVSFVSTADDYPIYEVIASTRYSDHYSILLERSKR